MEDFIPPVSITAAHLKPVHAQGPLASARLSSVPMPQHRWDGIPHKTLRL